MIPLLFALAAGPHCLDGYFDLGEKVAALGFACVLDEEGRNIGANIRFCNRKELLGRGTCSGRDDIPCRWQEPQQGWWCHENGYDAAIIPSGDDAIAFHFKSKLGEGDVSGTRIPAAALTGHHGETNVSPAPF